jgi:hypothetical protein
VFIYFLLRDEEEYLDLLLPSLPLRQLVSKQTLSWLWPINALVTNPSTTLLVIGRLFQEPNFRFSSSPFNGCKRHWNICKQDSINLPGTEMPWKTMESVYGPSIIQALHQSTNPIHMTTTTVMNTLMKPMTRTMV